jgi:hypothetical protein
LTETRRRLAIVVLGLETPQLGYAKFFSRSHDAVIHVYDETGGVIGLIAQRNTVRPIWEKPVRTFLADFADLPDHSSRPYNAIASEAKLQVI